MKRYTVIYFNDDNYTLAKEDPEFIHEFLNIPLSVIRIDDSPFKGVFELEVGIDDDEKGYTELMKRLFKVFHKHNINGLVFSPKSFLAYENDFYMTPIKKVFTSKNIAKLKKEAKKPYNKGKRAFIYDDGEISAIIPFTALE